MTTAELSYGFANDFVSKDEINIQQRREMRRQKSMANRAAVLKKDRKATLAIVIIVGAIMIGMVILTAFAADLKYTNNSLMAQNDELKDDIGILNVKIKSASGLSAIESKAENKLGMVYPDTSQYVYVTNDETPDSDFAMSIKQQVYN